MRVRVCVCVQYNNGCHSADDDVFYMFLQKQKIGAELHIYTLTKVRNIRGCLEALDNDYFHFLDTSELVAYYQKPTLSLSLGGLPRVVV